jgi:hypothetical protein
MIAQVAIEAPHTQIRDNISVPQLMIDVSARLTNALSGTM